MMCVGSSVCVRVGRVPLVLIKKDAFLVPLEQGRNGHCVCPAT